MDEKPFDVYEYSKDCLLTGQEILTKGWEILFAFALRQVNLFTLDDFLSYHLKSTFENNSQAMYKWVNLVLQEYSTLYDVNRLQSIKEGLQSVHKPYINSVQPVNEAYINSKHTVNKSVFTENIHKQSENNSKHTVKKSVFTENIHEQSENNGKHGEIPISNENNKVTISVTKEIMNISEASEFLGISTATLYYYTSKNLIPFMKKGKRLYFSKDELRSWLKEGKKLTIEENRAIAGDHIVTKKRSSK